MSKKIFYLVIFIGLLMFSCKEKDVLTQTELQVRIHDEPFKNSGKMVTELNINILELNIIRSSDKKLINLFKGNMALNILEITKNDPVILSTIKVECGRYEQLRLVLDNRSTIVVDNEKFDIKIPSGQQT